LARDLTCNGKSFFRYMVSRRKARENKGLLLNVNEVLVTKDMEKAEVLNESFISAFTSKTSLQESPSPESNEEVWSKEDLEEDLEDWIREH